jgi:hypothetical protein
MAKELEINESAGGKDGLMGIVESILKYSVNTWDQGFLDKLYASTNAVSMEVEKQCWYTTLTCRQGRTCQRTSPRNFEHKCASPAYPDSQ